MPCARISKNLEERRPEPLNHNAAEDQRQEILRVLRQTNGRVGGANGAAARMAIKRTTLIYRMKKLGIRSNDLCCSSGVISPWADSPEELA